MDLSTLPWGTLLFAIPIIFGVVGAVFLTITGKWK